MLTGNAWHCDIAVNNITDQYSRPSQSPQPDWFFPGATSVCRDRKEDKKHCRDPVPRRKVASCNSLTSLRSPRGNTSCNKTSIAHQAGHLVAAAIVISAWKRVLPN